MPRLLLVARNPALAFGLVSASDDIIEVRPSLVGRLDVLPDMADLLVIEQELPAEALRTLDMVRAGGLLAPALLVASARKEWADFDPGTRPSVSVLDPPVNQERLAQSVFTASGLADVRVDLWPGSLDDPAPDDDATPAVPEVAAETFDALAAEEPQARDVAVAVAEATPTPSVRPRRFGRKQKVAEVAVASAVAAQELADAAREAEAAEGDRLAAEQLAEDVRIAEEADAARLAEQAEQLRIAELAQEQAAEAQRRAHDAEVALIAEETRLAEDARLARAAEDARIAQEAEDARIAQEREDARIAQEAEDAELAAEAEQLSAAPAADDDAVPEGPPDLESSAEPVAQPRDSHDSRFYAEMASLVVASGEILAHQPDEVVPVPSEPTDDDVPLVDLSQVFADPTNRAGTTDVLPAEVAPPPAASHPPPASAPAPEAAPTGAVEVLDIRDPLPDDPRSTPGLVRALLARSHEVYGVSEAGALVVSDALARTGATAGALLLPDGDCWRVAAGEGLRRLEHRFELTADSWLVTTIASRHKGVIIDRTDVARQPLAGAPLAAHKHLVAAPVRSVAGILLIARDTDPAFGERDLLSIARLAEASTAILACALDARQLARLLADIRDQDERDVVDRIDYGL